MFLFLYRFICGYLYISFISKTPEKLLNLCAARGVTLWGVSIKNDVMYFKISIKSFKILRLLKRNVDGKIHITNKVGLPFVISKNRHRYGILVGVLLFLSVLQFLSGFVWNINVEGNSDVKSEDIILALNDIGIFEGVSLKSIDPKEKRNQLLLNVKGLSWAAINIEGTTVTVDVTERDIVEENSKDPSNLKAGYDGIIKKIEVISGTATVKVGDGVHKGDLLVSGFIEYADGSTGAVPSRGEIVARVEEEFTLTLENTVTEFERTGSTESRSILNFFWFKIPLFLGRVKGSYETESANANISGGEAYLPINFSKVTFFETEKKVKQLSESEIENRLKNKMNESIEERLGECEILAKEESFENLGEKTVMKCKIAALKNIVFEEKILIDTRN